MGFGLQGSSLSGGPVSALAPNATGTNLTLSGVMTDLREVITATSGVSLDVSANVGGATVIQMANGGILNFSVADTDAYLSRTASNTIRVGGGTNSIFNSGQLNASALLSSQGRFQLNTGDSSGTPGNATLNFAAGKSAIAAAASTCTITSNAVLGANDVIMVTAAANDATATRWAVTAVAAGSFTVTTNAAATATWPFYWQVITKNN